MNNTQLAKLDQATKLLAEAKTVQEVKQVIDLADLRILYVRKAKLGEEAERYAYEIKLEAQRKAGRYLKEIISRGGDRKSDKSKSKSDDTTLKTIGITKDQSSNWQKLAKLPSETFEQIKSGEITVQKAKQEIKSKVQNERALDIKNNPPKMPNGVFDLIFADPPWCYDFAETDSRDIENQYATMSIEDIKAMEIPSAENCVLYMWATAPKLQQAFEVLKAWGFEYKTCAVWNKEIIGSGYWFRGQHEILMVATKGKFSPPIQSDRVSSVYSEQRTKHSKKPEYYYDLLEQCFPNRSKLELFGRSKREGWSSFGNEI